MYGNGGIAQKRFGTGRRYFDIFRRGGGAVSIRKGVPDMVHSPFGFLMFNFIIGKRSTAGRAPVNQIVAAVDKPAFIEGNEYGTHGMGKPFVHRKPLPRPIDGGADFTQLIGDNRVVFFFDLPCALEKGFPSEVVPCFTFRLELAFNHILRCDTGMVGTGYPERFIAFHAVVADNDILQHVV